MPTAIAAVKTAFAGQVYPGDVFILNDPFQGGMHLPDVFIFKPIFQSGAEDAPIAWACAVCHQTDVGGRVPGSNASDSTEIYQEGLRIPPLKFYERGVRNETLFSLIEKNVRVPVKVFGDLRAQLAACHIAEQQVIELAAHCGAEKLSAYMPELVDYAERMTRAALRELPDGVYDFLDHIDDDGIDVGKPIPLKVTITKSGDAITVDWTGSAPQVKGAINNTLSYTKSASYCAIRSILPQNIPTNEGVFRAISVTAPEGTIANMVLPGACAARGLTGEAILQVRSDRRTFRPFGLYGGGPGKPSMNYLNPERNPAPLPSKLTMTMRRGDLFRHEVAGGGGWGDPLERDPALVLRDVLNEFISERAAREDYGVVLAGKPLTIDAAATKALREQLRTQRKWREVPVYNWGEALAAE